MLAADGVKLGKSIRNRYVGRAAAEPEHTAGACSLLNVSVGD